MTEMITGVDLIQEQIKAAQGQKLRFKQEDIQIKVLALPVHSLRSAVQTLVQLTLSRLTAWWSHQQGGWQAWHSSTSCAAGPSTKLLTRCCCAGACH